MAVFYADGNAFGKLQTCHCVSPESQIRWDGALREKRKAFLKAFLLEAKADPEWLAEGKALKFETLLWGGDECLFVMPAHLGWRFTRRFFEHFQEWQPEGFEGVTLTHSAALVYAQHHAPIHRLKRLAKDQMTEFAKSQDRKSDQLLCVPLESFDHLGASFEEAMRQRYGGALSDLDEILLRGTHDLPLCKRLAGIQKSISDLKRQEVEFARSQLRALVQERVRRGVRGEGFDEVLKNYLFKTREAGKDTLKDLQKCFKGVDAMWVMLEELWDYALP